MKEDTPAISADMSVVIAIIAVSVLRLKYLQVG